MFTFQDELDNNIHITYILHTYHMYHNCDSPNGGRKRICIIYIYMSSCMTNRNRCMGGNDIEASRSPGSSETSPLCPSPIWYFHGVSPGILLLVPWVSLGASETSPLCSALSHLQLLWEGCPQEADQNAECQSNEMEHLPWTQWWRPTFAQKFIVNEFIWLRPSQRAPIYIHASDSKWIYASSSKEASIASCITTTHHISTHPGGMFLNSSRARV